MRGVATKASRFAKWGYHLRPPSVSWQTSSIRAALELGIVNRLLESESHSHSENNSNNISSISSPRILVVNVGWWPHGRDTDEAEDMVKTALETGFDYVFWRENTPPSEMGRSDDDSSSSSSSSSSHLPYSDIEHRIRKLLSTISDSDIKSSNTKFRIVPFPYDPTTIPQSCWCDRLHFCCPELYLAQNFLIQKTIESLINTII